MTHDISNFFAITKYYYYYFLDEFYRRRQTNVEFIATIQLFCDDTQNQDILKRQLGQRTHSWGAPFGYIANPYSTVRRIQSPRHVQPGNPLQSLVRSQLPLRHHQIQSLHPTARNIRSNKLQLLHMLQEWLSEHLSRAHRCNFRTGGRSHQGLPFWREEVHAQVLPNVCLLTLCGSAYG